MKNFLAVDTSCNYLTVTAAKDGQRYSVAVPDCAMQHARTLMRAVDEVLEKANLRLEECDFFAAVVGAGSFTGIRIGISAAKGFALACGKPTLAITSFDALAYNALETVFQGGEAEKTLCLIDAMHGHYYACGYLGTTVIEEPAFLSETEVLKYVKDGFKLVSATEILLDGSVAAAVVDPVSGLTAAIEERCKNPENFGDLTALYIRKSSAEINLEKGVKVH